MSLLIINPASLPADSFNFALEMKKIANNRPAKSKSQKLANHFVKHVNPDAIPDGHCASAL